MNKAINYDMIYGAGIAILLYLFFTVVSKLLFDNQQCENSFYSMDNKTNCKDIVEMSNIKKLVFLMSIAIIGFIMYSYLDKYNTLKNGVGLGSIFLTISALILTGYNIKSNKIKAAFSGLGIIVLTVLSIKHTM